MCTAPKIGNILKIRIMIKELEQKLNNIERFSLLAAKNVLLLEDAQLITGLSKSTLYRLTCSKKIPHSKRGNTLYFDKKELEEWLMSCRIYTKEESEQAAINYTVMKGGAK